MLYIGNEPVIKKEILVPTGHYIVAANSSREATEKLMDMEDRLFFQLVRAAAPVQVIKSSLFKKRTKKYLKQAFRKIEQQDFIVAHVIMHPATYKKYIRAWVRTLVKNKNKNDNVMEYKCGEKRGLGEDYGNSIGHVYSADLMLSDLMFKNEILFLPEADHLGAMPVRAEQYLVHTNVYIQEAGQVIIYPERMLAMKIV